MLRAALLVIASVMLAAATFGAFAGWQLSATIPPAVWGLISAGDMLVERWRCRPLTNDRPGRGWQAKPKRFVDPRSGRLVKVFLNPDWGATPCRRQRAATRARG